MPYVPPPDYSAVQSAQQPPDSALVPEEIRNEQQAAIHRHLGTLAVSNAMGGTHQPK